LTPGKKKGYCTREGRENRILVFNNLFNILLLFTIRRLNIKFFLKKKFCRKPERRRNRSGVGPVSRPLLADFNPNADISRPSRFFQSIKAIRERLGERQKVSKE